MHKLTWRLVMVPILLLAAGLRLYGNDWDRYEHYHPDERYISWVASTIEAPTELRSALVPSESRFNPYYWPKGVTSDCIVAIQDEQRDFAYGHLPLYMGVVATRLVEQIAPSYGDNLTPTCRTADGSVIASEMDRIVSVARALTALIDVGSVLLIYLLGRKLFGDAEGVAAALILALTVSHIQLAHFFTSDPYMTFFVLASLYCMTRVQQAVRPGANLAAAAVFAGFAIGSKFSAIMLILPLLLTWVWGRGLALAHTRQGFKLFSSFVGTLLTVVLAFAVTNPFAILDLTCSVETAPLQLGPISIPTIDWGSCFLFNITKQAGMVNGAANFPFTRQYAGTLPYLYFLEMQLRWGMGPFAGIMGIVGSIWIVVQAIGRVRWRNLRNSAETLIRPSARPIWILLAFCVPFLVSTGNFFVKFMRYWQPLIPFMVLFGIGFIWSWRNRWLRRSAMAVVTVFTALYAFSFVSIYQQPHPWVAASLWVYENVPTDSTLLFERWGDRLPSTLVVDGTRLSSSTYRYTHDDLTWLSGIGPRDNEQKWVDNLSALADADYLIIDSNRIYGVVPRLKRLYPISHRVHQPLFDGSLGYETVFVANRTPRLGPFHLKPDYFSWPDLTPPDDVKEYLDSQAGITLGRADESFTLYDQSLVMVFENTGRFSAEQLNAIIAGVDTSSIPDTE